MSDKPKSSAADLVNAALNRPPSSPPSAPGAPVSADVGSASGGDATPAAGDDAPAPPSAEVQAAQDAAAEDLVELYFELEEPGERDNVFDRLMNIQSSVVTQFLQSMMANDEDDFMRACAAAELARRGDDAGVSALEKELRAPTDSQIFALAVDVLIELRGPAVYDLLRAIWSNPSYDTDERVEAMLGMEDSDPPRAMDDFVQFIASLKNMQALPDDQLEAVLAAFARSGHVAAKPELEALRQRVLASDLDEIERADIAGMIHEGLELLEMT